MHPFKVAAALCAAAALVLPGCSNNYDDPVAPPSRFSSLVSFGDSVSDVGTYAVGTVKAVGGGKYTVNAPDSKVWLELIAARLGQPAPCAAQTGLNGDPAQGFSVPVTNHPECTAYAQGGARVSEPIGPGNRALGGTNAIIGELTVPVVTQISNHLSTRGGRFAGDEIVFVMAGGNDLFIQLADVAAGSRVTDAIGAMAKAGDELAGLVRSMIEAGAKYVTVVNLPDASRAPLGLALTGDQQDVINGLTQAFNAALKLRLDGLDNVLYVDAYARGRDQAGNPAKYGITNVTMPACDLSPEKNLLSSALICTGANVVPGVIDRYMFSDVVHPAPYGHQLLADFVAGELVAKGWVK